MSNTITTDPLADMLTRIRNAIAVQKTQINVPYSRLKESVARLLKESNYVANVQTSGEGVARSLIITLRGEGENAHISSIDRISKPGRRYYVSAQEIPVVRRGRGIVIISTSHGIMTGETARAKRIGGELICKVY